MKDYMNKYLSYLVNSTLILLVIVVFAFFLRIFKLDEVPPSLYIDEVWSVYNPYLVAKGLLEVSLRGYIAYFLTGNYFTYSLFGASTFFTRLTSAIFGTGLVLVVYLLSNEMFGKRVGLVAAMLTAISPWGIQFSRYSVPASNYVFFATLFVYLMYKGIKAQAERKKLIYYVSSSITLGLTTYTHINSLAFIPVFLFGCILIFTSKFNKRVLINGLTYLSVAILSASMTIYEYINPNLLSNAGSRVSSSYSTFAISKDLGDLLSNIFERIYYHLSPDFLVTTGGAAFAAKTGFSETISQAALSKYTTGLTGTLNYYGIIIYPALIYLLYKIAKRSSLREERLLMWWIFAYVLASAVSYYDNPNAARNIVGLPALIIIMAVFLYRGFNFACVYIGRKFSLKKSKFLKIILSLTILASIAVPTIYYLDDYFINYPVRSARAFNYEYKMVADYLTAEALWNNTIYVRTDQSSWYSQQILSFYSPNQIPLNIFGIDSVESSWPVENGASSSLFITQHLSDLDKLKELGISYTEKKKFQLPNGETALYLVELLLPDTLSSVVEGFSKGEYSITFHDWTIGRHPEGLNLELQQDDKYGMVINYDYDGNETNWWYVYSVFENKIDLANYPLFNVLWNVQKEGEGSTFIEFLVETKDGNRSWLADNRFVYPAERYLLSNILKDYSSISGIMIGDEFQKGETGKIVVSELNFFKVAEVDITNSQNSKWNWIDVKDEGLLINRDSNITIPLSSPNEDRQLKYISFDIVPLKEGYVWVSLISDEGPLLETKIYYLEDRIETSQTFLIALKAPHKLNSITLKPTSPTVLLNVCCES